MEVERNCTFIVNESQLHLNDSRKKRMTEFGLAGELEEVLGALPWLTQGRIYLLDQLQGELIFDLLEGVEELQLPAAAEICFGPVERIHPADIAQFQAHRKRRTDESSLSRWEIEFRWLNEQNEYRWVQSRESVLSRDSDGKPEKVLGILLDTTERRQAEENAAVSSARYQRIVEALPDLLFHFDSEGHYLSVAGNKDLELLLPESEFIGRHYSDILPPDLAERFAYAFAQTENDSSVITIEYELEYADGHFEIHEARMVKTIDDQRIALVRDMTDRRRIESNLGRLTSYYETVIRTAAEGIAAFQLKEGQDQFEITIWNERMEEITGYDLEQINQEDGPRLVSIDGVQKCSLEKELRSMIRGGEVRDQEWTIINRAGEPRVLQMSSSSLTSADDPATVVLLVQDITERRIAEEQLAARDTFIARITAASPDLIYVYDLDKLETIYTNRLLSEHLGFGDNNKAYDAFKLFAEQLHPGDSAITDELVSRWEHAEDGEILESRFRLKDVDGEWRWMWSRDTVFERAPNGRVSRVVGTAKDITEWMRAEKRLLETRTFITRVAEAMPDILFAYDLASRSLTYQNRALEEQLGYANEFPANNDGDRFLSMIHEEDRQSVVDQLDLAAKGELSAIHEVELRIRRAEGGYRVFLSRCTGLHLDDEGVVSQVVGTLRDITDWRQAEEALRASESRLRSMLEDLDHVAVQAFELDGTVTYWNRASEELFGLNAAETIGRDVTKLICAGSKAEQFRELVAGTGRKPGVTHSQELEVERRDGEKRLVHSSHVLQHRPGKPPELFCFDVDISERLRYEEALAQRQAELMHVSRLTTVGQMVATISHEIAQPLSAMGNFAAACDQLLRTDGFPADSPVREMVQKILKQNGRCGEILQGLRDFSRRSTRRRSDCDIGEVILESLDLVASELKRKQVCVQHDLQGQTPVHCDRVLLQQVFVNLLNNAGDAVSSLPIDERKVEVRMREVDERIICEVSDVGVGVAEEQLSELFESFFTTKEHGMGMGLSICHSIVTDHGGQIEAVLNEGAGMTFRVTLPTKIRSVNRVSEQSKVLSDPGSMSSSS